MDMEIYRARFAVEAAEKWRERMDTIPYLRFPDSWEVAVIPPFNGAIARFRVRSGAANVSCYLDFDERLGCFGEPYWEIYPLDEDVGRYALNDTAGLLAGIAESIEQGNRRTSEARDDG